MKLKIEDIRAELQEKGWKVISEKYNNLNDEMEFDCPHGHRVFATYKKMRTKPECPVCDANPAYQEPTTIVPKPSGVKRVIGLDQATQTTGYSIYDSGKLIKYGTFTASGSKEIERDIQIKQWLLSLIKQWKPDCVGIEGIQFEEKIGGENRRIGVTTFETLARLQGILMATLTEAKQDYQICPTATWREFCGVKGRTRPDKKKSMRNLVKQWYDLEVSEDEADAIGIGRYISNVYNKNFEMVEW